MTHTILTHQDTVILNLQTLVAMENMSMILCKSFI